MPKAKRRKKSRSRGLAGNTADQPRVERAVSTGPSGSARRTSGASLQNVVFALLVALGCLGLAAFFAFFYGEDANHWLYAALMGVTAMGWLVISTRRWSTYRRRAQA